MSQIPGFSDVLSKICPTVYKNSLNHLLNDALNISGYRVDKYTKNDVHNHLSGKTLAACELINQGLYTQGLKR